MRDRRSSTKDFQNQLDRVWAPLPKSQFVGWLREEPGWAGKKRVVDAWVRTYLPHCPDNPDKFIDELRTNWLGSSWQMYLWLLLKKYQYDLAETSEKGPDIALFNYGRKTLWIECIAPSPGTGDLEAKPLPTERVIAGDPEGHKIILRISSALAAKAEIAKEYVDAQLISPNEPIVVAVSLASVSNAGTSRLESYCLRALYGVGQPVFVVPIGDPSSPIQAEQRFQAEIEKPSGAQVSLVPFASDKYPWIAGVLMNPFDVVHDPDLNGNSLWYFPNPFARNKVEEGFFRFGRETRIAEEDRRLYSVSHLQIQDSDVENIIAEILRELRDGK